MIHIPMQKTFQINKNMSRGVVKQFYYKNSSQLPEEFYSLKTIKFAIDLLECNYIINALTKLCQSPAADRQS